MLGSIVGSLVLDFFSFLEGKIFLFIFRFVLVNVFRELFKRVGFWIRWFVRGDVAIFLGKVLILVF